MIKNLKRTGGPKTAKGRAIASRNSIKTGAYAKNLLLDHESRKAFEDILETFRRQERPQSMVEDMLVVKLAETWTRLERLNYFEKTAYAQLENAPIKSAEWFAHLGIAYESILEKARKLSTLVGPSEEESFYWELRDRLNDLIKAFPENPPTPEVLKTQHFEMSRVLLRACELDEAALNQKLKENPPILLGVTFWSNALRRTQDWLKERLDCFEAANSVYHAIQPILDRRVCEYLLDGATTRATGDLQRQFFRVLAELRKEQAIRLSREEGVIHRPRVAALAVSETSSERELELENAS